MKDRFKFRVWDNFGGCYSFRSAGYDALFPTNKEVFKDKQRWVVEACTSLKDNAGKLIYEGDIVDLLTEIDETAVIEWDDITACFCIVSKSGGFVATFDNYRGDDLEIIGNIHEAPELLGGSEKCQIK